MRSSSVFINEIHYDNEGDDKGEGVELVGPAGTKRVRGTALTFIATGVTEDTLQAPMSEAGSDSITSSGWRGGFDLSPTDLESRVIKQTQKELDDYGLYVMRDTSGRPVGSGLCAGRGVGLVGESGRVGGWPVGCWVAVLGGWLCG